jgi:MFS family permease
MKESIFKDENGKFYYGWWIIILAAFLCIVGYSAIVSVTGVFLLPVTSDLGFPVGQFSIYISIMSATSIVTLLFVSKYITGKNIKKIMLIAALCGAASFFGFMVSNELWNFYAFAIPQGVCFSLIAMTPCMTLVSNWFGEKLRGKAISIFLAIMSIGTVVLINLLTHIVMTSGWRYGYLLCAILLLVSIPLILKLAVWSPESKGIKRIGSIPLPEGFDPSQIPGVPFGVAIKRPSTWIAFLSATFIVLISSAILQHGIATNIMNGFTPEQATGIISIMSLIMILTGIFIGFLCDRFPLSITAVGTCVFFIVAVVGIAYATPGSALMVIFMIGYIFGVPSINIITPLLMVHMFGEKEIGRFIGYSNMFIAVGGVFGAAMVGLMFDHFGSYQIPWMIMACILIIPTIIRAVCASKKMKFIPDEVKE